MKICMKCFMETFKESSHLYHITIKPPPKDEQIDRIFNFCEYLAKKDLPFFIVKCQSPSGYIHYHGVISFIVSQSLNNKDIKAIQRKVNRDMGFVSIDPLYSNLPKAYDYMRAPNNTNNGKWKQTDYISNKTSITHCSLI